MNLTKLFNFKYFKENVKKSKGIIALLLIIIPIFTTLFTVLVINDKEMISISTKGEISIINFAGMYTIPVLISFILFGYVFKKKSVDFINSQPINRKTIFITNTIGGILLLALIQLITAIALLICNIVLPNVVIFPQMIFDIFIMMWVAYSFVFLATNLAMTVSGTLCTQIVLTMLILFLVPFCFDCCRTLSSWNNLDIVVGEDSYTEFARIDRYYTLPYQPFSMIFANQTSDFDWFSIRSISRMVVLGIIYYFIGLHLFKKRKMENNEESFFNEKIHIIVKALTILPMILLLNIIEAGREFNIFAIAIIITYYFIYDFIVKRKINLKSSIIYLVLTMAVLQGTCSGLMIIRDVMPENEKVNVDNIASITFGAYNYRTQTAYNFNDVLKYGGYIENDEIIKIIFNSAYKVRGNTIDASAAIDTEVLEVATEEVKVEGDVPETPAEGKDFADCNIIIKTKTGKVYEINSTLIYSEDLDKVMSILSKDENYVSNIKNTYIRNGVDTINNIILLEKEEKEEIRKEIENAVKDMSLQELVNLSSTTETAGINKYFYKDHKLRGISCKDSVSDKVLKIVSKHLNDIVIRKIKNDEIKYFSYSVYYKKLNDRVYFNSLEKEIYKFIYDCQSEEFDTTKPYYIINIGGRHTLQFYTNKVDEIEKFIARQLEYDAEMYDEKVDYEFID